MRCSSCGSDHVNDTGVCDACDTEPSRSCASCGTANPGRFRFCGNCGAALEAAPGSPSRLRTFGRRVGDDTAGAERRHLTVMFCDLVGSTALSLRLDPEELREVVRAYQDAVAAAIERFDGYIAQYLGDGILAYFGYPVAHEDEGERAIRAGLAAVQAVETLAARLDLPEGIDLAVRIGVHTGEVVVGEVGGGARRERLALGDAPNIAARLQALASPNTVVLSEDTRRLLDGGILVEDLGVRSIKGIPAPLRVYRATGMRPTLEHVDAGNGAFVGRHDELSLLEDRWGRAREGAGQVVVLVGDPGIGKSQLVREFVRRGEVTRCSMLEARCMPYYRNTALFPFIDMLRRGSGCQPGLPVDQRLRALTELIESQGMSAEDTVPIFASLLSVPLDGSVEPADSPLELKERTHQALLDLVQTTAAREPVFMLIEDLHWADPSTLELLDSLVPLVARLPVFLLLTARHEFPVRWTEHDHVTSLAVRRLSDDQVADMVRGLAKGRIMPAEVMSAILARTDGVPLFVEELTRMVLESGLLRETPDAYVLDGPLPPLAIPGTLRDSLEARLDRLSTVKDVAQVAATIGREFDYVLLRAVASVPESRLRDALRQLEEAGLIVREGEPPDARYTFKHALIQEAAYQSLLRSTRQLHHLRIARVLEHEMPELARTQPELLAQHYAAAGMAAEAAESWTKAGRVALRRSANIEAVGHLSQGLEVVDRITDAKARANAELDLLALYAPALVTTRGYAAPEVRAAYSRARELAQRSDRTRHICQVLAGLFAHHLVRGELAAADVDAGELAELAESTDDAAVRLVSAAAKGVIRYATGDFTAAEPLLGQVVEAYQPELHAPLAFAFGHDFGVVGRAYSASTLGMAGDLDRARDQATLAVGTAERLGHPHSLALALAMQANLHHALRDVDVVRDAADRLLALSTQQRFTHWTMQALHFRSWVAAHDGEFDEAIRLSLDCGEAARRLGTTLPDTYYQPARLDILLLAGRAEEALTAIDELAAILAERRIRWALDPELLRLRADALGALGRPAEARLALSCAIDLAADRGARLVELRAAADLAEHLRALGRHEEATGLLIPRLARIRGGADVHDVVRAHALLRLPAKVAGPAEPLVLPA